MTCYHPLKGFPIGETAAGKVHYKITSYDADHVERSGETWKEAYDKRVSPYAEKVVHKYVEIPCGQCTGCRLQYSREWADRCMLEMREHEHNWFLTLTYDEEHLPVEEVFDPATGECFDFATLVKRDLQLFWKRLRKAVEPEKIRYYACGEYGDKTFRPHYHAIVFGLKLDDLQHYKYDGRFNYYNSPLLRQTWQKGEVIVANACWESAAYVARYVMKKQKGNTKGVYDDLSIEPEFVTMSRKPGLSRNYFDVKGVELFDFDRIYLDTGSSSKEFVPPRYYKRLFDELDPEEARRRSEKRMEVATARMLSKRKQTSVSYLDMLEIEEKMKQKQIKTLKRS